MCVYHEGIAVVLQSNGSENFVRSYKATVRAHTAELTRKKILLLKKRPKQKRNKQYIPYCVAEGYFAIAASTRST